MKFELNRIKRLRERLKAAFVELHNDEPEIAAKVKSEKVSENNPFLHSLKRDLQNRYGENIKGFSEFTLKRLFFDDKNLSYDKDSIIFLEHFCEEIENDISQKNSIEEASGNKSKEVIRRRRVWPYISLTILGFLTILYLVLSQMGSSLVDRFEEELSLGLVGEFNPDPAGKGTGFLSINYENKFGYDNKLDTISIPDMKPGQTAYFTLYIDLHNYGLVDIKNVKGKLYLQSDPYTHPFIITAELSAENAASIYDTAVITNYPTNARLDYTYGYIENRHGGTNPESCLGYEYFIEIGDEVFNEGVLLDKLDTYEDGWCDQGFIVAEFRLTNLQLPY